MTVTAAAITQNIKWPRAAEARANAIADQKQKLLHARGERATATEINKDKSIFSLRQPVYFDSPVPFK